MAVGLAELGVLHPVPGLRLAAVAAGIKKADRLDVVVFELAPGSTSAGVFTSNAFCAAPVQIARKHLAAAAPGLFLINTGNANAGTGEPGLQAALDCCAGLAEAAGVTRETVLPFSTGVIGEPLPVAKIRAVASTALAALDANAWPQAAVGIMTTDTLPKGCSRKLQLAGKDIVITGIAKGAGMIRPDMATMLAFIATDLDMAQHNVARSVRRHSERSFNRVTVDGDTSTNDACMLIATGHSGLQYEQLSQADKALFDSTLEEVFVTLAQAIVRDGEGATKFVTVRVEKGADSAECLAVAYAIAESPLVKTALFASDPNWGRILAAVGRAGVPDLEIAAVEVFLDDVCIVRGGARAVDYTEAAGQAVVAKEEFSIRVSLGRGTYSEEIWTCDFSHDYVTINAEYRS